MSPSYFYKEGTYVGQFSDWWSIVVKQDVNIWLAGLILCLVHDFTVNTVRF